MKFLGTNTDYLTASYSTDFDISDSGELSICLWYQGGSSAGGDFEELLSKGDAGHANNADYFLAIYDLNKPLFGGQNKHLWAQDTPKICPGGHDANPSFAT